MAVRMSVLLTNRVERENIVVKKTTSNKNHRKVK
jgi:hypothetical protein